MLWFTTLEVYMFHRWETCWKCWPDVACSFSQGWNSLLFMIDSQRPRGHNRKSVPVGPKLSEMHKLFEQNCPNLVIKAFSSINVLKFMNGAKRRTRFKSRAFKFEFCLLNNSKCFQSWSVGMNLVIQMLINLIFIY